MEKSESFWTPVETMTGSILGIFRTVPGIALNAVLQLHNDNNVGNEDWKNLWTESKKVE